MVYHHPLHQSGFFHLRIPVKGIGTISNRDDSNILILQSKWRLLRIIGRNNSTDAKDDKFNIIPNLKTNTNVQLDQNQIKPFNEPRCE